MLFLRCHIFAKLLRIGDKFLVVFILHICPSETAVKQFNNSIALIIANSSSTTFGGPPSPLEKAYAKRNCLQFCSRNNGFKAAVEDAPQLNLSPSQGRGAADKLLPQKGRMRMHHLKNNPPLNCNLP
jgi:hypothetical protein